MWYTIFKFELQYRAKSLETYLYFGVLFLFSLVAFNFIYEGQNIGLVKENAPYIIAKVMSISAGIFMIISSLIMGVPVLRDFQYNTASLLFVTPIKKRDYLLGRFLGSFLVLVLVFSALIWGMSVGEWLPWRAADKLLPFQFWHYLQPFLTLVVPTLFFGGSLFFVSGALSRNLMVVYTQGVLFFVVFILSRQLENPFIAAIIEPFSFMAVGEVVQTWSLEERNSLVVSLQGVLLYNRLFWMSIGILVLWIGYVVFDFNLIKGQPSKAQKANIFQAEKIPQTAFKMPNITLQTGFWAKLKQWQAHTWFYTKGILYARSFWSLLLCGVVIILINSINLGTYYGVDSYPTTYFIVEELQELSIYFFLMILVFYSGELIWKERDIHFHEIYDVLPISNFMILVSKLCALILIYVFLLFALMLSGIIFQTVQGYYQYEIGVYMMGFFLELLPFLVFYTFLSFFIQVTVNSKFIGYMLVLVSFLVTLALDILNYGHALCRFGGVSLGKYSDMNGYGHFLEPYLWFLGYWLAFCVLLLVFAAVFNLRGTEPSFKNRWQWSRQNLSPSLVKLGSLAFLTFMLIGSYIFYNTNVLNDYWTHTEKQEFRANYEKTLKKMQDLPQPKITAVNLKVELYPSQRNYAVAGYYWLKNPHEEAIQDIYIQKWIDPQITIEEITFEGEVNENDKYQEYDFNHYILKQPLATGDSIKMTFKQSFKTQGFVESNPSTRIIENGTFLGNYHFPTLAYNPKIELRDKQDREKYGLAPRKKLAKRDSAAAIEKKGEEGHNIQFEIIIGTDADQTAVAPGTLQKKWTAHQRNYFHYKMEAPMIDFYALVSARYQVLHDQWFSPQDSLSKPVDLEIYYHPGHEYNLDRMMEAMKVSFDYFSTNFSPYQYQQMRIMEFPRYESFAQSFPNTVPFSESMGFILNINDSTDVDMSFFITAHEVAHQWWGMQIMAADVQGRHMILESLAQYSALMVLQKKYSKVKVQQFLDMELKAYLNGRNADAGQEVPLALVEGQEYIYYRKGAVNFYALQDYIGEDNVNLALSRFIEDWHILDNQLRQGRYPNTRDLLGYFRAVTPDSLQYVIDDLFETITLYDNTALTGTYTKISPQQYQVNLNIQAKKYQVDSLGIEVPVGLKDWIEVGVYAPTTNGEEELIYLKKHQILSREQFLELVVDKKPSRAGIDPLHKLIDKKVEDNVVQLNAILDGDDK